jgi:Caspase domain
VSGARTGASPRLLNPTSTVAVVLGAHDWTDAGLNPALSYLRSARNIVKYLYDPAGLGLDPQFVLDLFDDMSGAGDQLARLTKTLDAQLRNRSNKGEPITDVLVYYVGHGCTDEQGHLTLLIRRSHKGLEAETGIKATDLAKALRLAAPQQRRSVILDCCFSEAAARAFMGMGGDLNQQVGATAAKDLKDDQPARGTLLLCSSPVGEPSYGAPDDEHTLFTGAVLKVLNEGAEGRPQFLSFAQLRDETYERMVASFGLNAPRPVLHQPNAARGDLTEAPAFPNRIARELRPKREEEPLKRQAGAEQQEAEEQRLLAEAKANLQARIPPAGNGALSTKTISLPGSIGPRIDRNSNAQSDRLAKPGSKPFFAIGNILRGIGNIVAEIVGWLGIAVIVVMVLAVVGYAFVVVFVKL